MHQQKKEQYDFSFIPIYRRTHVQGFPHMYLIFIIDVSYCANQHTFPYQKSSHLFSKKKKKKIFPEFSLQKLIQMNFKVSTITKKKLTYIMNLNLLTQCIFAMLTTCTWIHTSMNHDNELAGILTSTSTLIFFEFMYIVELPSTFSGSWGVIVASTPKWGTFILIDDPFNLLHVVPV